MKPESAHVKGTDLVVIKTMLKEKNSGGLESFLLELTPETRGLFQTIMPTTWVPSQAASEIMEKAARALYPGRPDDLEQLGRDCARHAFNGIYKTFLRISSLAFLLNRVPLVWNMYHSAGKAVITVSDEKSGATLVVTGAPDVQVQTLRLVSGFSMQALEMAGAKNLSCQLTTQNPQAWQWTFRLTV